MFNIASIVTPDYIDRAVTMFKSINKFIEAKLHLLVVTCGYTKYEFPEFENVHILELKELLAGVESRVNRLIYHKYRRVDQQSLPSIIAPLDYLRWSLKPGFVNYLLADNNNVIYCDNDLFFYQDPTDIFKYCLKYDFTISPHWRTINQGHTDEMKYNFLHGLYNGGFFTCKKSAKNILDWWADNCCIECSATSETTYVDQKYLDLLPLYFDKQVGILKHKGCNVAAWNRNYLERKIESDGTVSVDGHPIVFIHYSPITMKYIEQGLDPLLLDHLLTYNDQLMQVRIDLIRNGFNECVSGKVIEEDFI